MALAGRSSGSRSSICLAWGYRGGEIRQSEAWAAPPEVGPGADGVAAGGGAVQVPPGVDAPLPDEGGGVGSLDCSARGKDPLHIYTCKFLD